MRITRLHKNVKLTREQCSGLFMLPLPFAESHKRKNSFKSPLRASPRPPFFPARDVPWTGKCTHQHSGKVKTRHQALKCRHSMAWQGKPPTNPSMFPTWRGTCENWKSWTSSKTEMFLKWKWCPSWTRALITLRQYSSFSTLLSMSVLTVDES